MHVLSLPPAFVLSQDQTLKLVLKTCSRHVTIVQLTLNQGQPKPAPLDESQTHPSASPKTSRRDESGNVTVGLSLAVPKHEVRRSEPQGHRRPRFSFFRCNCQTAESQTKPTPNDKPSTEAPDDDTPGKPCQALYLRANSEASKTAARPQAAPPVDDPDIQTTHHNVNQKRHKTEKRRGGQPTPPSGATAGRWSDRGIGAPASPPTQAQTRGQRGHER